MAQSPAHAGNPRAFGTSHGERRNGGQMVGTGQDVNGSGEQSSDGCNHLFAQSALSTTKGQRKVRPSYQQDFTAMDWGRRTRIDKEEPFFGGGTAGRG